MLPADASLSDRILWAGLAAIVGAAHDGPEVGTEHVLFERLEAAARSFGVPPPSIGREKTWTLPCCCALKTRVLPSGVKVKPSACASQSSARMRVSPLPRSKRASRPKWGWMWGRVLRP